MIARSEWTCSYISTKLAFDAPGGDVYLADEDTYPSVSGVRCESLMLHLGRKAVQPGLVAETQ